MALIKCPECGKEFSDKAEECPNCGCPVRKIITEKDQYDKDDSVSEESTKKAARKFNAKALFVICGAIAAIGILIYFLSADFRSYQHAMENMENGNYEAALQEFNTLGTYRDSVDKARECENQLSVDAGFLRELSKGLMERWDQGVADEQSGDLYSDESKCYAHYCDIELHHLEDYRDKKFEDSALGDDAVKYINLLQEAKDATQYYTVNYSKYLYQWEDVYAERTGLIKKFVDNYGLQVDESHQETLDEILNDAVASENSTNGEGNIRLMNKG